MIRGNDEPSRNSTSPMINNGQRKTRLPMKKFLCLIAICSFLPLIAACTKSVERAQRDVQRAHNQAVQNIERKQEDLQDTKRDAADRIARQERRVEDTARQETDKVR